MPRIPDTKSKVLEANPEMKEKIFSFEHVRKCHDAILFGGIKRNAMLCNSYYVEMRKFIDNCKKEVAYGKIMV